MEKKKWIAVWCILAVLVVGMGASITLSAVMFSKVSGLKTSVDRKMMLLLLTNTQLNQQKISLMHIKKEKKIL